MKIELNSLYAVREEIGELVKKELPIKIALGIRRALKSIANELDIAEPERQKILGKYSKGIVEGRYKLPEKSDVDFEEFENNWNLLMRQIVDIDYETIDLSLLASANITIKPSVLEMIESLNQMNSKGE